MPNLRFWTGPTLLMMILTQPLFAQREGLRFEAISSNEGLSQNSVQVMIQDRQGFLWFGTIDGLNRYDGYEFTCFRSETHPGLRSNDINALYEDTTGAIWIGTHGGGMSRYQKGIMEKVDLPGDNNLIIRDMLEDGQGALWIATQGSGLIRKKGDKVAIYEDAPFTSVQGNAFWRLTLDAGGQLWVGAGNDFFFYYDPRADLLSGYNLPGVGTIYDLIFDSEGGLWLGSDKGLWHYDRFDPQNPGEPEVFRHDPQDETSLPDDRVWDIFEDSLGMIWVGTQNGLCLYRPEKHNFIPYLASPGDPRGMISRMIISIMEDRSGIMWIGTGQGLNKFNRRARYISYLSDNPNDRDSPKISFAKAILEDRHKRIWLGSFGQGLSLLDRDHRLLHHFAGQPDQKATLPGSIILALLEDEKGRIWAGSDLGLSWFSEERQEFQTFKLGEETIDFSQITGLLEDPPYLWVTGHAGLARIHEEEQKCEWFLPDDGGWQDNYPISILRHSSGLIYFGTMVGGFFQLDPKTGVAQQFQHADGQPTSLSQNRVTSFLELHGSLWVGTHGGLNLMDPDRGSFRSWTVEQGLPSNVIYAILTDASQNIWLSTNLGLSRFETRTETFTNYGLQDGLQDWEFNRHSAFRSRDGELFFGGIRGVNSFFPEQFTQSTYVPPITLTRISVLDQLVSNLDPTLTRELVLKPNENVVSFSFSALDFNMPSKNTYACRLDGFHDRWVDLGHNRNYTFTNLDPGDYTFRVKGASSDGTWNEEGFALKVKVLPNWWETLWFRAFLGLALVIMPMLIQWWRLKLARRQHLTLQKEISRRLAAEEAMKQLNSHLEQRVAERTEQLEVAQRDMIDNAHRAGMSEIASSVLHNVGNVLNSLITSSEVIREEFEKLPGKNLELANQKLQQVLEDNHVLDHQAQMLLSYYEKINKMFESSKLKLSDNIERIMNKVSIIRAIIIAQQGYATLGAAPELISLARVTDDALKIQEASLLRHHIQVTRAFQEGPLVRFHKARLIHIIINLIKNAKEAMESCPKNQRHLKLQLQFTQTHALLSFSDNGDGILKEYLDQVFLHGFTTKTFGHGFGLNSCAAAMKEMGGSIMVESPGPGQGAVFILSFLLEQESDRIRPE